MGIFGLPLFLGRGQECREASNELKMNCNNQATQQISALPCVLPFLGLAISFQSLNFCSAVIHPSPCRLWRPVWTLGRQRCKAMPRAGCNSIFQCPSPVPRVAVSLELPPQELLGAQCVSQEIQYCCVILTQFLESFLAKEIMKQWDQALRVCRAGVGGNDTLGMAAQRAGKALAGTGVGTKPPPVNSVLLQAPAAL